MNCGCLHTCMNVYIYMHIELVQYHMYIHVHVHVHLCASDSVTELQYLCCVNCICICICIYVCVHLYLLALAINVIKSHIFSCTVQHGLMESLRDCCTPRTPEVDCVEYMMLSSQSTYCVLCALYYFLCLSQLYSLLVLFVCLVSGLPFFLPTRTFMQVHVSVQHTFTVFPFIHDV